MQTYTRWTVRGPVTGTSRALVDAAADMVESLRPRELALLLPAQREVSRPAVLAAA